MEFSMWAGSITQPNPNPNPNPYLSPLPPDQLVYHHYPTPYSSSSYYSHNPNPGVITHESSYSVVRPTLNPPGTDPYSSSAQNPVRIYEAYAHYQTYVDSVPATAAQPLVDSVQSWAVHELVHQHGGAAPKDGAGQLVPATSYSAMWATPAVNPRGPSKKGPKQIKVVQSQFCEVCKITCNTKEVLDKHKTGKKHQKNLEKLKDGTAAGPSNNPLIGPQEKPGTGNSLTGQKRIKVETAEDLETKKRKVMEGGAAASAVRSCGLCNVVCNSETVFRTHLVGQKHIAMVKKLTGGTG